MHAFFNTANLLRGPTVQISQIQPSAVAMAVARSLALPFPNTDTMSLPRVIPAVPAPLPPLVAPAFGPKADAYRERCPWVNQNRSAMAEQQSYQRMQSDAARAVALQAAAQKDAVKAQEEGVASDLDAVFVRVVREKLLALLTTFLSAMIPPADQVDWMVRSLSPQEKALIIAKWSTVDLGDDEDAVHSRNVLLANIITPKLAMETMVQK